MLYFDAQGKGLLQLEDVMARALQDLRARFTYHSIAALTRRHCVIPVVDGFDELIGPSSAREAFANLAQFLAQLDCEGALITSSRSAFIDYRTLYERAAEIAATQSLSYEIYPVEVLPWGRSEVSKYCALKSPDSPDLQTRIDQLLDTDVGRLISNPFFLQQVCSILLEGKAIDATSDLVKQVVDAALEREADKLKDSRGRQLLSRAQHQTFCEAIAEEMWAQGKAELDVETIRLLAEIFADDSGLSGRDAKTLIDRSVAHAVLAPVVGEETKRAFEHELFRFEFLAARLAVALAGHTTAVEDFLHRAELPTAVISRVAAQRGWPGDTIVSIVRQLSSAAIASPRSPFASSNAGSIVCGLLKDRDDLPPRVTLAGLYVRAQDLGKCVLREAEIRECLFERTDVAQARLERCRFEGTTLIACIFAKETRWPETVLEATSVLGVLLRTGEGLTEVHDPQKVVGLMKGWGLAAAAEVNVPEPEVLSAEAERRVAVLERLLTHARSHYYLSKADPWVRNNLLADREWPYVEKVLRRYKLLEDVKLQKSGQAEVFWHLTMAADRVWQARGDKGDGRAAASFWTEVLSGS